MTTLEDAIRGTIEAYLARTNMSARRFGVLALGDPSFVSSLKSGRSIRLDTADRVLQFMDEAPIGPKFRDEVEAFLSRTEMKPYKLGEKALGDPSFVQKLMSGASPQSAPSSAYGAGCTTPIPPQARDHSSRNVFAGANPFPGAMKRRSSRRARPRPCSHSRPERSTVFEKTEPAPGTTGGATHRVRARRPPRLGVVEAREPRILNNDKPYSLLQTLFPVIDALSMCSASMASLVPWRLGE